MVLKIDYDVIFDFMTSFVWRYKDSITENTASK